MSWEQAPHPTGHRHRWVSAIVVGGVIGTVALAMLVNADPRNTLVIDPKSAPVDSRADLAQTAHTVAFLPADLEPLPTTNEISGARPALRDTSATTILAASRTKLHRIDVVTGNGRSFRLPDVLSADGPVSMFKVGDSVIISGYNVVVRLSGNDLRATRTASPYYGLQTIADSSVWLLATGQSNSTRTALRVDLDGKVQDRVVVPAIIEPAVGTSDLLVASAPGGVSLLSANGVNSQALSGRIIAVGNGRLARTECTVKLACWTVMGTYQNPNQVRVRLAANDVPGSAGSLTGQFSPDGRWLALPLYPADAPGVYRSATISIINTATGVEVDREESGSAHPFFVGQVAWTPDSRWLVVPTNSGLKAWHAGQRRTVVLDVNIPNIGGVLVR